ncbi:integral membrane sensor signal transduction histidine kinase (plasmid) [Streptomyces sp. GBA 94-10 4N24]|nr:integral membrane sensor signal transduction histidine kinase [Streptomyces sp. GBA 94-10 4N24]UZN63051.1 integral membrane sensor signal transduction histidine kinase [Streptomyces sp. GBA 94-10 4N24]
MPKAHPVLFLASVLYVVHLGALLRPVWTGRPCPARRSALLVPALVWPVCLLLLPYTGAFARSEVVPLSGMAAVPAAVVVAGLPVGARLTAGATCVVVAAAASPHAPLPSALSAGGVLLTVLLAVRSAMRPLSVISRLSGAADAAALLGVTEERLRISRDLHDTLGRHLAIIAIKSELIVRTRRLEEMEEVQVLARASQGDLRAVVNAARTASLDEELEGACSLLRAYGVRCDVTGGHSGLRLPCEVRAALGWAVREAATNIIRHAYDATACTITLSLSGAGEARECVLRVVNDGMRDRPDRRLNLGVGMTGLRQRVAPLGGRLEHGLRANGTYRLLVAVPLRER